MTCPYLDRNFPCCNSILNMNRLKQVFELCSDHYELCPLYLEMAHSYLTTNTTCVLNPISSTTDPAPEMVYTHTT